MPDEDQEQLQPPQRQTQPGIEQEMTPEPDPGPRHQGSGKLAGKVALITGGDSGIGRAVAVLFAREGADVAIGHLPEEDTDANETVKLVQAEGRRLKGAESRTWHMSCQFASTARYGDTLLPWLGRPP